MPWSPSMKVMALLVDDVLTKPRSNALKPVRFSNSDMSTALGPSVEDCTPKVATVSPKDSRTSWPKFKFVSFLFRDRECRPRSLSRRLGYRRRREHAGPILSPYGFISWVEFVRWAESTSACNRGQLQLPITHTGAKRMVRDSPSGFRPGFPGSNGFLEKHL